MSKKFRLYIIKINSTKLVVAVVVYFCFNEYYWSTILEIKRIKTMYTYLITGLLSKANLLISLACFEFRCTGKHKLDSFQMIQRWKTL